MKTFLGFNQIVKSVLCNIAYKMVGKEYIIVGLPDNPPGFKIKMRDCLVNPTVLTKAAFESWKKEKAKMEDIVNSVGKAALDKL